MKRFLLFTGDNYYPCGGMRDYKGDYNTLEEALKASQNIPEGWNWLQIYDIVENKMVWEKD